MGMGKVTARLDSQGCFQLRNGILLLRCSASTATLVFQFSKRLEGADRFLSEGMQFTLLFTQLVIHQIWHCISAELHMVLRTGEAAGHKDGFKTSLIPVSSYPEAPWSQQNREQTQ